MPDARISRSRYEEIRDELAALRTRVGQLEAREDLAVQLATQLAQACLVLLRRQPQPPMQKRGAL